MNPITMRDIREELGFRLDACIDSALASIPDEIYNVNPNYWASFVGAFSREVDKAIEEVLS